jgi:hypothetical protein
VSLKNEFIELCAHNAFDDSAIYVQQPTFMSGRNISLAGIGNASGVQESYRLVKPFEETNSRWFATRIK